MDACTFPELLALDLETAVPIFAAKRMTAGAPRPSTAGAASSTPRTLPLDFLSMLHKERGCKSPCEDVFDQLQSSSDTSQQTVQVDESNVHPIFSSYDSIIANDGDNESVDSFEIPNINLVSPRCVRSEQQRQQQQFQQLRQSREEDAAQEQLLRSDCYVPSVHRDIGRDDNNDNNKPNLSGDNQHNFENFFEDNANSSEGGYNILSDASSLSSFGLTTSLSPPNQRHSILTAATSVASGSRSSALSHTLCAIGPSSPPPMPLSPRHVEFKSDDDIINLSRETTCSDVMDKSNDSILCQTSWIDFGDDESREEAAQPLFQDIHLPITRPSSAVSRASRPYSPFAGRPRSAMSWFERERRDQDMLSTRADKKRLSQASAVSAPSLRHRSAFYFYEKAASLSGMHSSMENNNDDTNEYNGNEQNFIVYEETGNDTDILTEFDETDEIMTATMVPLSRQLPASVSSRQVSVDEAVTTATVMSPASFSGKTYNVEMFDPEETSHELQSWIRRTSETQGEFSRASLRRQNSAFPFDRQSHAVSEQDGDDFAPVRPVLQPSWSQPTVHNNSQPTVPSFFQPSAPVVAMPLPKEVVDMLRVAVANFPATTLSLSSFCIETICSYAHKVRRCGEALDPSSSTSLMTASPLSPSAPSSPRRFWGLTRRLMPSRTMPNLSGLNGDVEDVDKKRTGACLKRIFPTGADHLCDALYAHIVAFNYITLLCGQTPDPSPSRNKPKQPAVRAYVDLEAVVEQPFPLSPPNTPPPSRGTMRTDDDGGLLVSRKAAILLGIEDGLETVEEMRSVLRRSAETSRSGGNSGHRYSFRLLGRGGDRGERSRTVVKKAVTRVPIKERQIVPLTPPSVSTDASMWELQAGLYGCMRQLVVTLKLTTGQLEDDARLDAAAREVDPLFLRTLCELVRTQEE